MGNKKHLAVSKASRSNQAASNAHKLTNRQKLFIGIPPPVDDYLLTRADHQGQLEHQIGSDRRCLVVNCVSLLFGVTQSSSISSLVFVVVWPVSFHCFQARLCGVQASLECRLYVSVGSGP